MAERSWLSLLGLVVLAALGLLALVLLFSSRIRRNVRLRVKQSMELRNKLMFELGLALGDGSLQAFGKAHQMMTDATMFPMVNGAYELGLFELLKNNPMSEEAIAEQVKAKNTWALTQLLLYMSIRGIMFVKAGANGEKLYYHNLPDKALEALAMTFKMFKLVNYKQLLHLPESIKTGEAVGLNKYFPGSTSLYHARELYPEVDRDWTPWMEMQTESQMGPAIESLDLSACSHVLDWCGSVGYNSVKLLKKFPNLSATVLDLPKVAAQVPETAKAAGLDPKRLQAISVDLSEKVVELPADTFDAVLMSNCVIEWCEEDLLKFFKAIKKALKPGGKVYVLSSLTGSHNQQNNQLEMEKHLLRFTAYFIAAADSSSCIHEKDAIERLLREAGFTTVSSRVVMVYGNSAPTCVEAS